jgi:chromosome segregation ATPase
MSTLEPDEDSPEAKDGGTGADGADPTDADAAPKKGRSPWLWVSAGLAVVAVGLLIWGLSTKSDLDSANKKVADLESQVKQSSATGAAAGVTFKAAYDDVTKELGTTNEDLATTQQDLEQAKQDQAKAEKAAAAAKDDAAQAKDALAKANAEADQAKAEAQAAESKNAIAADCANAYVSEVGKLFEGDDPAAQADEVKKELDSIAADCKAALAGN